MRDLSRAWTKALRAGVLKIELARAIQDGIVTAAEIRRWLSVRPKRRRR